MTDHLQHLPLNRLVPSKLNVRRTALTTLTGGIEELMASIAAHGLRENLNVKPTAAGRFEVIAADRMLTALRKLAQRDVIPADMPVRCLVQVQVPCAPMVAPTLPEATSAPDQNSEPVRNAA